MEWTLHLKFDNDPTDYSTGILEGAELVECVGAKGKHATQSCSISIFDTILAAKIFNSSKDIDARIYNGNTVWFEGVIRPYATLQAELCYEKQLKLEVIDYTQILHYYVYTDLSDLSSITQEAKDKCIQTFVCENANLSDLIERLFALTRITDKVRLVIPSIANTKRYFCLEAGKYIDDVIEDLLYEYSLDYRFTPGVLTVFSTQVVDANSNPIEPQDSISEFNLAFEISKEDQVDDGVRINYGDYASGKYTIYREDNRWDTDWWRAIWTSEHKHGYYYKRGMHSSLDEYGDKVPWDFSELSGKTIVGISDLTIKEELHDEVGVSYEGYCDSYDKDGGKPYIAYDGTFNYNWGNGWGFVLSVEAKVFYRDGSLKYQGAIGLNPVELTTEFIENQTEAQLLCSNVQARNERSVYNYSFSSFKALVPGALVRLNEDKVTGVETVIRIISRKFDPIAGLYKYTAEGAGEVAIPELFSGSNGGASSSPNASQSYLISLVASKSSFIVEEADCDISVTVDGILFTQRGCVPQWSFNGAVQDESGLVLALRKSLLRIGINTVKCSTVLDGQIYERTITITLIQAALDLSSDYEWTVTETLDPPVARETFFEFDGYLLCFDGYYIVLDDIWTREQPDVAQDEFLWLRLPTSTDGEYAVIRMTGNPYRDFSVYSDPVAYQNSKRLTTDRVVTIGVSYGNIKDPVISYLLVGNPVGVMQDPDQRNVFYIKAGETPESFTVQVTIVGIGSKSLTILGADVPENIVMYLGRTDIMPPVESDMRFVDGDWILYMGEDTETYKKGHVYKKNGDNWTETTDIKDLSDVYWDTADLRTQNIYARVLFAESILTENLLVQGKFLFQKTVNGNVSSLEISEDGMNAKYGEAGKQESIFSFDFDTGNIFIGKANESGTAPAFGFMYDPSNKTISSANKLTVIREDGSIEALNLKASKATISGESYFSGEFNCSSIQAKAKDKTIIPYSIAGSDGVYQARRVEDIINDDNLVRCSVDFCSDIHYVIARWYSEELDVFFYDKDFKEVDISQWTSGCSNLWYKSVGSDMGGYRHYGSYIASGFTLSLIVAGNILIVDIPSNLNSDGIESLEVGQLYAMSDGSVKIKQ